MADSPASGWYPDPQGPPGQQKWWDGAAWTDHTREGGTAPTVAPAPAPRKTRWWAWVVIGFVVLVIIGAASSSEDDSSDTGPNLALDPTTETAPTPTETTSTPPQKPLHFEGNGTRSIGTIHLSRDSVLTWTNRGGYGDFSIDNVSSDDLDDPSLFISSTHHSGESIMDAGTYHHVNVDGGDWLIDIAAK